MPIRVELNALTKEDLIRILREPEANLIRQSLALMETEKVQLEFTSDAIIEAMAELAAKVNEEIENIGARRLHTILEKVIEEISFDASEKAGESIRINRDYVENTVRELAKNQDLSKFIL